MRGVDAYGDPAMMGQYPLSDTRRRVGAPLAAAVLLGASLGLAGLVVTSRGLGEPVRLPGWSITFRPPRGWPQGTLSQGRGSESVPFRSPTEGRGAATVLVVTRIDNPQRMPVETICVESAAEILNVRSGIQIAQLGQTLEAAPLGPMPGARITLGLDRGIYVHAGRLESADGSSEAYVVSLVGAPGDVSLGAAVADSVRRVEP